MSREDKIKHLSDKVSEFIDGETELQIIRLQGVFKGKLLEKLYDGNKICGLRLECLDNSNPDYPKGAEASISFNDGGLIDLEKIVSKKL